MAGIHMELEPKVKILDRKPVTPSGTCVLHACVGASAKWSGEWQISKNFGVCGASLANFYLNFAKLSATPMSASCA